MPSVIKERPAYKTAAKVHLFDVEDAIQHGTDAAIILYNLRYWLDNNRANWNNVRDGYVWTYNTAEAFSALFPYWKSAKIARLLRSLEEKGTIKSGYFNSDVRDRTKWYTMPEFKIQAKTEEQIDNSHCSKMNNGISENEHSIHCSKMNNVLLSNINTDNKHTPIVPLSKITEKPEGLNLDAWSQWLAYKKEIKSPYKTERGELSKAKELIKLANGDMAYQVYLVNHAIDNEWKGIYAPKTGGTGRKSNFDVVQDQNQEAINEWLGLGPGDNGFNGNTYENGE